jgi:Leucine-rich repeat (LRR) protein
MKSWVYLTIAFLLVFSGINPISAASQSNTKFSCADITEIPHSECEALVSLYESTNGPGWEDNENWLTTWPPSMWFGVTVTSGHVTRLVLDDNRLDGSLPPDIDQLTFLEDLELYGNSLSGSLPPQLGSLSHLIFLILYDNYFTGTIPAALGNLTALTYLSLGFNQLTGSIPAELGNLTNLQTLNLYTNRLTGSKPASLGNLTQLVRAIW